MAKFTVSRLILPVLGAAATVFLHPVVSWAVTVNSHDAYVRVDEQKRSIIIGSNSVDERVELVNGHYLLRSLQNRATHREYVTEGSISSEFRLSVNGKTITGDSGEWEWLGAQAKVLDQGEIELAVKLQDKILEVEKHYVVYPGSSIIRQWVVFKNRSDGAINVTDPYLMDEHILTRTTSSQTLSYMTGGGSFTGSQVLKQISLTDAYSRSFDTKDKAELETVEGIRYDMSMAYASGRYMPWFCISSAQAKEGLFIGFDYYGHWVAETGNFEGSPGYLGVRIAGYAKQLLPGESLETPKAFTGVYAGDLDDMGNQLKGWEYQYLWDYTNDDYFSKIRYAAEMRWQPQKGGEWGGGTDDNWDYRMSAMFHAADVIRYVGADILWQDAGWHDNLGDNDGPDFAGVNQYINKSGVRLAVWWPLWYAEKQSKVLREHPDWGSGGVFRGPLDVSRPEVTQWMTNQLNQKVQEWGNFQWREDGSAVDPVAGNETPMLAQYHNIMQMQKQFRKQHPESSIDLCAGGGNLMSFEGLRLADVSQLTDGGSLSYGNYYSSYLFPPDKIDDWTRTQNATPNNVATTLTMAPAWMGDRGLYAHEPGILLGDGRENLRRTFENYHYLTHEGVAGRWVQIYHPKVEGDEPVFYLERLSKDGHRGVIVLKHFIQGQIHIYPKGLHPSETYDVRFQEAKSTAKRTGEDLARNGITLLNPKPSELIYLGLPNHPGSGTDSISPTSVSQVMKRTGTNMGVTGVELQWNAATDNNWLSYYQIYRDGEPLDRVSKGLYYFDHSAAANMASVYQVQAVDGDGNGSALVEGTSTNGPAEVYTALGGYLAGKDYSYQGANNWSYEQWNGSERTPATWNGALGQQGLYQGSPAEHQLLIGASWMRPSNRDDAVKVFTVPRSGQIMIKGNVHKDIYHTHGDGVRVKIMKGNQQIWPDNGWMTIAAEDIKGKDVEQSFSATAGDQIYFIVNSNADATDDETVWNPQVTFTTSQEITAPKVQVALDDVDNAITYSGAGWQSTGTPPWSKGAGIGGDIGYLPGRYGGTLSVSGTSGDKLKLTFSGTGVQVIGDVGSDHGIAQISIDGEDKGLIDTFVPENYPSFSAGATGLARRPNDVPVTPPIVLWSTTRLTEGEHILEVTVTGRKNPESTGSFIGVDELWISGKPIETSKSH